MTQDAPTVSPKSDPDLKAAPQQLGLVNNQKAAYLFLGGIVISTAMTWMLKTLGKSYGPFQIMLARNLVMALCLMPVLLLRMAKTGAFAQFSLSVGPKASPVKLISRSLLAFGGQAFGIAAIAQMPLAQSQALSFIKGFIVLGLAVTMLKEKVGPRHWIGMIIGFVGVIIAVQPGTDFNPAALLAIASAVCFAFSTIVVKQLTQEVDNLTLMGWGALAQALICVPLALLWWVQPSLADLAIMACLGLVAIILQNLMLAAYRIGDVSFLSPLDYLRLITSVILGLFAFQEMPTTAILVGAVLIIIANLVTTQRSVLR